MESQVPMLEVNRSVANYVDVVGNWRLHHVTEEVISTLMPPSSLMYFLRIIMEGH